MLTFLVLATPDGRALTPDMTARLTAVPTGLLGHEPETRSVWLAEGQHVGFAGWQTRPELVGGSHWHVGEHGVTAVTGAPMPVAGMLGDDTSWASQLTARLDEDRTPHAATTGFAGSYALVRLAADGSGWITSDALASADLHVAETDGLLVISNDAALALDVAGGDVSAARDDRLAADLPWAGTVLGDRSAYRGVRRLGPGESVRIDPAGGAQIAQELPTWGSGERDRPALTALAGRLRDALAAAVRIPASAHVLDVSDLDDARLLLAACVSAGVAEKVVARTAGAVDDPRVRTVDSLCADAGVRLERREPAAVDLGTIDLHLRADVGATRGATPSPVDPTPLVDDGEILITGLGASTLRTLARDLDGADLTDQLGLDPAGIVAEPSRSDLRAWLTEWSRSAVESGIGEADLADVFELRHRLPRRLASTAARVAPVPVLAPFAADDVISLSATWGQDRRAGRLQRSLVEELAPSMLPADVPPPEGEPATEDVPGAPDLDGGEGPGERHLPWTQVYPLVEAELLGRPGGPLDAVLDRDVIRKALREGTPEPRIQSALWAATSAAIWLTGGEVTDVVRRRTPRVEVTPRELPSRPVLITGVTSRSFIELAQLKVPLERTERDPLLAVRVDREVAELTDRLLVSVDASVGDVPPDIDERLASSETAGFADAARTLLARRNGVLADPRLGLTLPFWKAHVADPKVVLVAERPTDLLARLERPLPAERVLASWLDVVTAALSVGADVRCVDPDDISDTPLGPEGDVAAANPGTDRTAFEELLSVTSVVDSLIRELEVDAVRPIVREIRRARLSVKRSAPTRPSTNAGYPLAALDALTDLRQKVSAAEQSQAQAEAERDEAREAFEALRSRRTVRWAVSWARALGRPGLPDTPGGEG